MSRIQLSDQLIDELSVFLRREFARLEDLYNWPVSKWDTFKAPTSISHYQATLALRRHLNAEWLADAAADDFIEHSKYPSLWLSQPNEAVQQVLSA